MPASATDTTTSGHRRREDDVAALARGVADALKDSVAELRKDEEARMSQLTVALHGEFSAFRESEETRIVRLEKAIASWKPVKTEADPTTNFWTVYKSVADEHDDEMVKKYVADLDTSLLFAGLFSAVATAFIIQIIPGIQPNPADLTNVLLLRILQQNTSFGHDDPLKPISNVSASAVRAQSILLASLSVTLLVAFIAVLGKQWISYYTQAKSWGNIVDRGKERQVKFVGLQKWRLQLVMEMLPVMLQFALLLFGVAVVVYLWDLNAPIASVVLVVTSVGLVFYVCIAAFATVYNNCPFQTPLSKLLQRVPVWWKEFTTALRVRSTPKVALPRPKVGSMTELDTLKNPADPMPRNLTAGTNALNHASEGGDTPIKNPPMTLSDPKYWRSQPLFTPTPPEDIGASAGFWLLENSTGSSTASAVATVFTELQWPSCHASTTALIRLRDVYAECVQAPEFEESIRLKALQSAAAYYVLYHTQLFWDVSNSLEGEVGKLPPDLLLLPQSDKWDRDDLFEHLLRLEDRSKPLTSGRFLAHIAPYWFCGDSDSAVRFRPSRLPTLNKLIGVLRKSQMLNPTTLTDCVLCVGAAMDFPLHPDDLIRVDKSDYFASTFKMVVEHIHGLILARSRRRHHAQTALEILLTLSEKATLPLVDAAWIKDLLKSAASGEMGDETFTLFLRLSARRKEGEVTIETETPSGQDHAHVQESETDPLVPGGAMPSDAITLDDTLFLKIVQNIQTSGEKDGWKDEAVYGGLIAIRDIPRLGSFLPDSDTLEMFSKTMGETVPFRVRKATFDVIVVAREGWLKSAELYQTIERLDLPRQLHSIAVETGHPKHQCSFLTVMEILSEDGYWHSYLREAMVIWLSLYRVGPGQVLRIFTRVADLPLPEYNGTNPPPFDEFLAKLVEDEWARVPGKLVGGLTADRLQPLAEVTTQLKELLFTEAQRKKVFDVVDLVIPRLGNQRDGGGPGKEVRRIVDALLQILRAPIRSTSHRYSFR